MSRPPFALANWKMAMTIEEGLAFLRTFLPLVEPWVGRMTIVLCPPATALAPMARALPPETVALGAQDCSAEADPAHTGQLSASLLADAGARWVLLGHWEVRRQQGDDDARVNRKLHRALEAGLRPILLVGEARDEAEEAPSALARSMARLLEGCTAEQVATMAFVYEPEWTIGVAEPAPVAHVAAGADFLRNWLAARYGEAVAQAVPVIYGGSVTPEHAQALLAVPSVDGLGAGRKGRDPHAFARIVESVARQRLAGGEGPPTTSA